MRDLIFRPMFSLADMISATLAGALALSGHWLASLPVAIIGGLIAHYGRRRMLRRPSFRKAPR
jgi:hypothetical protein